MKKIFHIFFYILLTINMLPCPAAKASPTPEEQLKSLLQAHPELILDVLREHSGELLDIVQQGSDIRRRTTLMTHCQSAIHPHKIVNFQ